MCKIRIILSCDCETLLTHNKYLDKQGSSYIKLHLILTNIHVLHRERVYSHVSDINIYSDI